MLLFAGYQNSTTLTSLHCSIRSKVEVNFADVFGFDPRRAPRKYRRFVCLYGFHLDVLDSVYVPILLYSCTRIQYVALAIFLSYSGERMHRDKIPPRRRMHAACRIVTQGSYCTKRFAEFNGNCEKYFSLKQLVASLWATHEGKPASGTYHPKTEGYTRRYLYRPPGLLYWGGCIWTRISRQPIIAITWHFSQQTLLEPLTVTGASAFCFGERYWDVLSQNLDENNSTQTRTDCCTVVCKQFSYSTGVCACYIQFAGYTNIVCSYVESNSVQNLLQMMIPLLLRRQQREEPAKIHIECGTEDAMSVPPLKCGCFGSAA